MKNIKSYSIVILAAFLLACHSTGNQGEFAQFDMINAVAPSNNLVTGGQPSVADLERLAKSGTKVVVNLRTKGEFKGFDEKAAVEKLGMRYVSIEIGGSDGITLKNAKRLDQALNNLEQPALVHCASSNRVGGLLAYRAFSLQHKTAEEAILFGKSAGMRSTEKKVRKLIELAK